MQCIHCGYQLSAFDTKCPRCGKSQSDPVVAAAPPVAAPPPAPAPYGAPPQPYGAPPPYGYGQQPALPDGPDTVFALLGFFIPIVGIILYFVTQGRQPRKASSALKGALWGIVAGAVPFILIIVLTMMGRRISNTFNTSKSVNPAFVRPQSGSSKPQQFGPILPATFPREANAEKNAPQTAITLTSNRQSWRITSL